MNEAGTAKTTWAWVLQVAGAVAGLAALMYLVGAVTMWVRLWHAGYRPDRGLEHMSHAFLIALGIRGVLWVTLLAAAIGLAALGLRRCYRSLAARLAPDDEDALPPTETERRRSRRRDGVAIGLVLAALVVVGAFVGWRWFGAFVAGAAGIAVAYWYPDVRNAAKPFVTLAVLTMTAAIAAICWEVGKTAKIDAVVLSPVPKEMLERSPSPELLDQVGFPYFGETAKYVYVGQIRTVMRSLVRPGGYDFNVCGEHNDIVEVARDGLALRFMSDQDRFNRRLEPPALFLWHRLFGGSMGEVRSSAPEPGFSRTAYERRRLYLCHRLEVMNHPLS